MNNEYVIINKTELLKVMETNQKPESHHDGIYVSEAQNAKADLIEKILSQSTPLIPVVEKAFTAGERYGWDSQKSIGNIDEMREKIKLQSLDNYISNLKLDI